MSIGNLKETLARISVASRHSPIAVFVSKSYHGNTKSQQKFKRRRALDSVFADTLLTKLWLGEGKRQYIGTYHALSSYESTRKELKRALD